MKINIVVTYSDNYIIGYDNNIPWDNNEQNIFLDVINVAIFGYNTYISKYYNIYNNSQIKIIITSKKLQNDIENNLYFVDSLGSSIDLCNKMLLKNIYIMGGEEIYTYFCKSYYYKFLDKVYITRIHKKYEGNKYFYGLEEKFYYIDVKQSIKYPEIEHRVLQYNSAFINPEMTYLNKLKDMLRNNSNNSYNLKLDINLSKYFPLFSIIKNKKDEILSNIFISLKNISYNKTINLIGIQPYDSIYNFDINDNYISCIVIHTKGNVLNEVLCNIVFSSLLVIFMAKILKLKPHNLKYTCTNNYFIDSDEYIIDKISWEVPDVLPILNIKDRNQTTLQDFIISDLNFLGLII